MGRLIDFLAANPIVLLVVGVWIVGMIGNIAKAAKNAREKAERALRPAPRSAPLEPGRVQPPPAPREARSTEEIAREMRRILGGDRPGDGSSGGDDRGADEWPQPMPVPPPLPRTQPRPVRRVDIAEPERAPVAVVPTTAARRLEIHVAPHVGEQMAHRTTPASGRVGEHAPGSELGSLGGRVHHEVEGRIRANRYALVDLKRAIVMNEILGRPLALRSARDREL